MYFKLKNCSIQIICLSLLLSGCTNIFFQPLKRHLASPEQFKIEYEDINFKGEGGINLHGWWFPAKLQSNKTSLGTVLFLHGNGENISTHSGLVYWLTQYNFDVFIFDYRGYGHSEGSSEIVGVLNDIDSAREYVVSRNQKHKLFIIGHSLGASLGIVNLAKNSAAVDGIILVSPFSDYRKITREMMSKFWLTWAFQWPMSLTVSAEYNPIDFVDALPKVPKLFLYSEDDRVINSEHIKALYAKAPLPKSIAMVKGQHNNVFAEKVSREVILSHLQAWSRDKLLLE